MQLKAHCDHRISYHHTNFISQVHSNTVLTNNYKDLVGYKFKQFFFNSEQYLHPLTAPITHFEYTNQIRVHSE